MVAVVSTRCCCFGPVFLLGSLKGIQRDIVAIFFSSGRGGFLSLGLQHFSLGRTIRAEFDDFLPEVTQPIVTRRRRWISTTRPHQRFVCRKCAAIPGTQYDTEDEVKNPGACKTHFHFAPIVVVGCRCAESESREERRHRPRRAPPTAGSSILELDYGGLGYGPEINIPLAKSASAFLIL